MQIDQFYRISLDYMDANYSYFMKWCAYNDVKPITDSVFVCAVVSSTLYKKLEKDMLMWGKSEQEIFEEFAEINHDITKDENGIYKNDRTYELFQVFLLGRK